MLAILANQYVSVCVFAWSVNARNRSEIIFEFMWKLSSAYRHTMGDSNPFWAGALPSSVSVPPPDVCTFLVALTLEYIELCQMNAHFLIFFLFVTHLQTLRHLFRDSDCTHFNKKKNRLLIFPNVQCRFSGMVSFRRFSFLFLFALNLHRPRYCSKYGIRHFRLMVWV